LLPGGHKPNAIASSIAQTRSLVLGMSQPYTFCPGRQLFSQNSVFETPHPPPPPPPPSAAPEDKTDHETDGHGQAAG
jgi:hypothetical protein